MASAPNQTRHDEQSAPADALPEHIEETVSAIARLHENHLGEATRLQRLVERTIARASRPEFAAVLALLIAGWAALNGFIMFEGHAPLDQPPFFWMQGVVTLTALFMTILILATQRREDQIATSREQLTLELAILSERKTAKVIALLEELRRDLTNAPDRDDHQAAMFSKPADPEAVLGAIKDRHERIADQR